MTQRLETLRQKYDRYIRTGNHVKALQVMQEIARLSAVRETVERTTIRDLYEALSPADKEKATDLCTEIMLFADLLQSASVDLQEIVHRADPAADLILHQEVKQIARLSGSIVRNVDALGRRLFLLLIWRPGRPLSLSTSTTSSMPSGQKKNAKTHEYGANLRTTAL